jgi:hypothetical protein
MAKRSSKRVVVDESRVIPQSHDIVLKGEL